jgi:hypothetical protein
MKSFVLTLVQGRQKAIVSGFVAAGLVLLPLVGVDGNMTVTDALQIVGSGLVSGYLTWLKANRT